MIRRGRMTVNLEFSRAAHEAEAMKRVLDSMRLALLALGRDPSSDEADFELAGLDEAGLSRVAELLAEIDGA